MATGDFRLAAAHEWVAHDPFGRVKPADASAPPSLPGGAGEVRLRAARNGYVSFRLLVSGAGEYRLSASADGGLEVDIFKAWYHRLAQQKGQPPVWAPDALVPLGADAALRLPDPDNRIPGQTTQEFWIDVFVPRDARPGSISGTLRLASGVASKELALRGEVLEAVIPDEPCVLMDNNTYGCRGLPGLYPQAHARARGERAKWLATIELLQNYYRLAHEHRGCLHNLGHGHFGELAGPVYAPRLAGRGRKLRLTDWDLHDRLFGPLFTGKAFAKAAPGMPRPRRSAEPIWGVYSPIHVNWPADYLWWGEPAFEVEFVSGLKQYDEHLRRKGWTGSRIEVFTNHKKRYRSYEWDGDEAKFAKDDAYHLELARMMKKATAGSPVKWIYRMDASWQMKNEFERLAGSTEFWVCGGFLKWYPEEARQVIARGDVLWSYGGLPAISATSSAVLRSTLATWARGLTGHTPWLTNSPSADPWFASEGENTALMYPGERFGIPGPIPSIRFKVQRNAIQDVDMIDRAARAGGRLEQVRREMAETTGVHLWEKPPRAARELPPEDWDSINLSTEHEPGMQPEPALRPSWWQPLRESALAGR